jgi:response regulator NasT
MNRSLRVLVADDELDTREFLQEMLTRMGHQVAVAQTGRQLLDLARVSEPELVVADIKMPDMDGIEAAETLNRERKVPFILVSGHHDPDLLRRATAQPVMAYLIKPITQSDLEAAIPVALMRFEQYIEARKETEAVKQALEERKLVERAKGSIMRRLRVDEEESFRLLRKMSSTQNRKLPDVARTILQAEEVFMDLERL